MTHGGRFCHTPFDISEKFMRRSLFEPPIGPYYSYDFFFFEILWTQSWEITWSKFQNLRWNHHFRVLTAKIAFWQNFICLSEKSNFHRKHPKYDDFIINKKFPTKWCIDSSLKKIYPIKNFWPETPYIIGYIWFSTKKNFPQKFFKMAYSQPQKVIWGHTSISNEILESQGVVTK